MTSNIMDDIFENHWSMFSCCRYEQHQATSFMKESLKNEGDHTIFIEYQKESDDFSKGHFNFIKNMANYSNTMAFCYSCRRAHWSKDHRCEFVCSVCGQAPICKDGEPVDCDCCSVTFVNQRCYDNHVDNNSTETRPPL